MERDFCIADMFMPRKTPLTRSGGFIVFRTQYDCIPCDVPKLSDEDARGAIPERFKVQTMLAEVQVLDFVAEETTTSNPRKMPTSGCCRTR